MNRRFTQVATSDDEDELPPQQSRLRKRKRMKLLEEDNDDDDIDNDNDNENEKEEESEEKKEKAAEQSQTPEDAKPVGDPVRVSGKGRGRKRHYDFFEFDGNQYTLVSFTLLRNLIIHFKSLNLFSFWFLQEDPVLLVPEDKQQKPYVAIIKVFPFSIVHFVIITSLSGFDEELYLINSTSFCLR